MVAMVDPLPLGAKNPAGIVAGFAYWLRTHRGALTMAGLFAFAAPVTFFPGAVSAMRDPTTEDLMMLALWFVLLLALRHVGVSEHEVSAIQVLAVFAFARLLSAAPITPGGVGFVELALIGGLYAAGRHHADVPLDMFKVEVTSAALLYRALTYGIQIPLGGFTYLIWRRKKSWRKPDGGQPTAAPEVPESVPG